MGYLASRSVLTILNRVMRESGVPEVAAITSNNAKVVLEALNDGVADIWQRQRWTFQRYTAALALVANQQDYALPADFDRMASNFRVGIVAMEEVTPEQWWNLKYGDISQYGQPMVYTIEGLVVKFFPIPGSTFVTAYPTLSYQYFKAVTPRRTTADIASSWDLPLDFEDALVKYGKAKFKQFLEYPDWQSDMQGYELALKTLRDKYREVRVAPKWQSLETPQVW